MRGNALNASVEGTLSRGKRDRDLESAQTLSERQHLHVYLEQKAELADQGECVAQRRFSEAEADMNIRNWEQRILIWPFMKPIEASNLRDWSCIRQINGQIRLKVKRLIYVENWK